MRYRSFRSLAWLGTATALGAACGETNDNPHDAGAAGAAAGGPSAGQAGATHAGTNNDSGGSSAGTSSAGHGGALGEGGTPASGGATEPGSAGAGGDNESLAGGAGGHCEQACEPEQPVGQSVFCGDEEVSWVCHSIGFNPELFQSECTDAGTNAIRYCCPAAFQGECL